MDKDAILEMARQDPQFERAVDMLEARISQMPAMAEDLDQIIQTLELVMRDPSKYAQVRQLAIQEGYIAAEQIPEQFDPKFVISLLAALYALQERMSQKQFAEGGLASAARQLQRMGRGGDSILAHINPREAEMLKRMGGSGTVNPNTGLREFKGGGGGSFLSVVAPIVLDYIVPGAGEILGGVLGLEGAAASVVGNAIIGGGSSALTGGNVLQGAVMGGLNAGLGNLVGEGVAPAMSKSAQGLIGSGLVGGASGLLTGKGFLQGALQGGLGQLASDKIGGMAGNDMLGKAVTGGGRTFGNALAAGYDPKTAVKMGALSGLAAGVRNVVTDPLSGNMVKGMTPSKEAVANFGMGEGAATDNTATWTGQPGSDANLRVNQFGSDTGRVQGDYGDLAPSQSTPEQGVRPSPIRSVSDMSGGQSTLSNLSALAGKASNLVPLALMASSLQQAPQPVQQAITTLPAAQQEIFNRPSTYWDWDKLTADAKLANQPLATYIGTNWPQITSGAYNVQKKAQGGALSKMAYLARGSGSGRADTISAKLSDGEYVMDAETVALMGDGSTKEGARRLDAMREQLRRQKGKALAKGKFSPGAKSPLAYIKEVA